MSLPILATGHGDFVETPQGDWYMVFLGIRPQNPRNASGQPQLNRETFMAPVTWEDDWPVVNHNQPITFEMPGLYDLARPKLWRDEFNGDFADKGDVSSPSVGSSGTYVNHVLAGYYTQRTPYKAFHSFTARQNYLRLRGNPYTLSDRETPAAFFRKQVDLETVWSTELDFQPTSPMHEAGATVFLSIQYHNEIAVMLHPNDTSRRVVTAQTRTGPDATLNQTYYDIPSTGSVSLFIKAERASYSLGFAIGNEEPKYVATFGSEWLQAFLPGWQVFTGAHFGVYSTGNSLPMLVPAVRCICL
jgi:beta-xylosidase